MIMRKHQGTGPGAWARLEERVVPSPGLAAEVGPGVAVTPQVQLDLRGTVRGLAIRSVQSAVDTWQLSGSGVVAPLGRVRASGSLTIPHGASSTYDGQLTLVAGRGDVFVHIHSIVGGQGRYIVTGGTGQYHGAT